MTATEPTTDEPTPEPEPELEPAPVPSPEPEPVRPVNDIPSSHELAPDGPVPDKRQGGDGPSSHETA